MTDLLGERVRVCGSTHRPLVGACGTAVAETARTVLLDEGGPVPRVLPKDACSFELGGRVVDGRSLGRPERRP